ncbi:ATP-dependent zinc metalloprotease FtsH [Solirubrobacter ginsenosidimutans]|uniref:ATP-dependent zinc metalloprotease FtsH n=1 Tax=Solirubrobacter ginsenosidimutans TaxID=490573 RepID=A0A9X3RZC1_9ACTN|nr:ATP-dependent zinc metalloprotease FtsH [Solirubrobacter ginsenosidimutans]MDA0159989.1 ATP-dependent zinc metalloprotease FtsH [Solirubrobacter ginsenosidimutans]
MRLPKLSFEPLAIAFATLAALLLVVFLVMLGATQPRSNGVELPYSSVQRMAAAGQVRRATQLDYDHRLLITDRAGRESWTSYPANGALEDQLLSQLSAKGAAVVIDSQSSKQARRLIVQVLLPILILAALFALFMRLSQQSDAGGMGGFSRWRGRRSALGPGNVGGPSFDDVAGAGGAVAELQELCDLLRFPERYAALGARAPKGALLVGPPGTGKTLLARATAGEAHAAFFSVSGAEFVESLVGIGAARIRDLFAQARAAAPAIVFIDELDAVGRKRGAGVGQGNDEREQTLNQLLVEMDGFDAGRGLIVLAATNRPDILDPALLRPGRFDRQITVDAPDLEGRTAILDLYLADRPCDPDVVAVDIARRCPGFTGAELENVVNEAALLSARSGQRMIGVHDLDEAIQRVVGGPRTETHVLSDEELETIAIHEAAHAVVASAYGDGDQLHNLSIVARGRRLGRATALLLHRDRAVLRRSDLERQLTVTMAGAAAERLAFGEVSTAVNEDLHTATQLARSMVTSFGMSSLGPVTIGEHSAEVFLGASLQELGSVGPGTLERIDAETRAIVEAAEERAMATLRMNWVVVEAIARDLVEYETLDGVPLLAHLAGVHAAPLRDVDGGNVAP